MESFDVHKMIGDVPGYLVYVMTRILALFGITFLGGYFILLKTPTTDSKYTCKENIPSDTSNILKWIAWSRMALWATLSNSTIILSFLSKILSKLPDMVIFYGVAVVALMCISAVIYPVSWMLSLYASFQPCEGFADKFIFTVPIVYFSMLCQENWAKDPDDDIWSTIFKYFSWIFHMLFHLIQACIFMISNVIIWSVSAAINSFMILFELFLRPFTKINPIFEQMNKYSTSMSIIILAVLLYGAYLYLSLYVFIGFCIAGGVILFKRIITECLKNKTI